MKPNDVHHFDKPDIKLVRALQKDFERFYTPAYTQGAKSRRQLINIELGVMRLDYTQKYILDCINERERNIINSLRG